MPDNSIYQSSSETNNTWKDLISGGERGIYDEVAARLTRFGLASLVPEVTRLIQKYGKDMPETINTELMGTQAYQDRFRGNEERRKAGLSVLSESEYLYNELQYNQILGSYGAKDLATKENFVKFIGGDVSPTELQNRFDAAVTKINQAVTSNDQPLLAELKKLYPMAQPENLATAVLMGTEGSNYLRNKFGVAEIKAAETETGYKSMLGADFLQSQGLSRNEARQGFAQAASELTGLQAVAGIYGDTRNPTDIQTELEKEKVLGQQSRKNKELASRSRAAFGGAAGIASQSLQRKDVGNI